MGRWSKIEQDGINEMRRRLKNEIDNAVPFPEVVGDRRLIRFLRGTELNVDKATEQYGNFLGWRKKFNVDEIRQNIVRVYKGLDTPLKFPAGDKIIKIAPQIILTANAFNRNKQPIAVETFDFSPKTFMDISSIDEYLIFLTYSLEYRAIILEQLSHQFECEYLSSNPEAISGLAPYGCVVRLCHIRDMKGISIEHIGKQGRSLVLAALKLGLPNYPDFLGVAYFVNVPWIFYSFWYFVKQFLDADTLRKVNMTSDDYIDVLQTGDLGIDIDNIPQMLGGNFSLYNESFNFDTSIDGPLYYPGAPISEDLATELQYKDNNAYRDKISDSVESSIQSKDNGVIDICQSSSECNEIRVLNASPKSDSDYPKNENLTNETLENKVNAQDKLFLFFKISLLPIYIIFILIYRLEKIGWVVFPLLVIILFSDEL